MDDGTAFDLLGKTASLIINGRRVDDVMVTVMVTGNQISTRGPGFIDLLLPTPIGQPDRRIRVRLDRVELAS